MSQATSTIFDLASDVPSILSCNLNINHSGRLSHGMSDINFDRPSSEANVQARTVRSQFIFPPRTAGSRSSRIQITLWSGLSRATRSSLPELDTEHERHRQDVMAETSSRHANRALEIGQRSSPPKPTLWHESIHRDQLVRVWDTVCDVTARNPNYPKCTTSQVGSTLNAMVKRCPELGQGKVPLTRDWIEYVLGKALRPPFCTAAMMGRWEILASSGGARSMWGPW